MNTATQSQSVAPKRISDLSDLEYYVMVFVSRVSKGGKYPFALEGLAAKLEAPAGIGDDSDLCDAVDALIYEHRLISFNWSVRTLVTPTLFRVTKHGRARMSTHGGFNRFRGE